MCQFGRPVKLDELAVAELSVSANELAAAAVAVAVVGRAADR